MLSGEDKKDEQMREIKKIKFDYMNVVREIVLVLPRDPSYAIRKV